MVFIDGIGVDIGRGRGEVEGVESRIEWCERVVERGEGAAASALRRRSNDGGWGCRKVVLDVYLSAPGDASPLLRKWAGVLYAPGRQPRVVQERRVEAGAAHGRNTPVFLSTILAGPVFTLTFSSSSSDSSSSAKGERRDDDGDPATLSGILHHALPPGKKPPSSSRCSSSPFHHPGGAREGASIAVGRSSSSVYGYGSVGNIGQVEGEPVVMGEKSSGVSVHTARGGSIEINEKASYAGDDENGEFFFVRGACLGGLLESGTAADALVDEGGSGRVCEESERRKLQIHAIRMLQSFSAAFLGIAPRTISTFQTLAANFNCIRTPNHYNDGQGSIYHVALVNRDDIVQFKNSDRHLKSPERLLAATTMKLGYTKDLSRHLRTYEPCTRSGSLTLLWMGYYQVDRRIFDEAYLHYVLEHSNLPRVPFMCECGTVHRKFHRFPGLGHWDQLMTGGLTSLGVKASKIWLPPSSLSLSPEMRDAYEIICKS
ncbi:hypothetical protein R3P38DRAFT_2812290 [Favolaschia claudopus]|uniref:Uncharacterized protein n=1 Tax=Favolaschia claudopus TaxID=2862362 RepID=A0AAV9Z7G8_9AGAR